MKRQFTTRTAAAMALTLAVAGVAWGNGEEFFTPTDPDTPINLVYVGHLREKGSGRLIKDQASIMITDDHNIMSFPFTGDVPGHYRSPDVGAFAAFERSASNEADGRPDESGGAGLGLAIVRMIIEGHGGQVSAANRPAGGLTVQLIVPDGSHPSQPTADARAATSQRAHAAHRGRR